MDLKLANVINLTLTQYFVLDQTRRPPPRHEPREPASARYTAAVWPGGSTHRVCHNPPRSLDDVVAAGNP